MDTIKALLTAVVIHMEFLHATESVRQNSVELSHWVWDLCMSGIAGHADVISQTEEEKLFFQ